MQKLSLGAVVLLAGIAGAEPTKQPTLTLETPMITGKFNAKILTSTVKRRKKKLLACYTKAFAKDKRLEAAAVNATFTIGSDGKLTNLVVSIGELPKSIETCVAGVFSAIRFAKRKGAEPVEVTYPLAFVPPTDAWDVLKAGGFASITGTDNDPDDPSIYGGLTGVAPTGGGGTGWGTIGTSGSGSGTGSGYGVGASRGGMRGRPSSVPTTSIGQPDTKGDLDKAIIRRYIKRNIQKLQYCYEKELLTQAKLEGTSTAEFVIGVEGTVTSSTASGLDATVDMCIADVIKAIEFPKPKGGVVAVRYPLTFRPAETAPAKKP